MSVAGLGLGADLRYLESGSADDVRRLLASTFPQEKLHGMKSIFGMAALNQNVIIFFADVVKNVVIDNMEVKKLVYLYLINYAKSNPDLTIMAVNAFVKDSEHPSPLIRALAIRTMGCIRVEKITEYLTPPLKKALSDDDPYVRKTAALCVAKLHDISPTVVRQQGFIESVRDGLRLVWQ
jgi:vesicle coat complex subunit